MSKTRFLHLFDGQLRDPSENRRTMGIGGARWGPGRVDFSASFVRHYASFAPACRSFEQPGLAVVAVDLVTDQLAGVACVAAKIGEPNALIIGRHSEADLLLRGDEALSLRHLAIIIDPITRLDRPGRDTHYRVIDLRSSHGLEVEGGRVLGGLRADGPAFLCTGRYAFLIFVTGDPTDWPDSAALAWSYIPERIYLEERPRLAEGTGQHRRDASGPARGGSTTIRKVMRPWAASDGPLLAAQEPAIAELIVTGEGRQARLPIGRTALEAGVLLGRDDRCEAATALTDRILSRVHLLVVDVQGTVWGVDTASTNGCFATDGSDVARRVLPLDDGANISLAHMASAGWRWLERPPGG